eukprot:4090810-Amphidinium_carterae.1
MSPRRCVLCFEWFDCCWSNLLGAIGHEWTYFKRMDLALDSLSLFLIIAINEVELSSDHSRFFPACNHKWVKENSTRPPIPGIIRSLL